MCSSDLADANLGIPPKRDPKHLDYPAWQPRKWRPGIHMFRWMCRLTLEVTSVRIERVQDISGEDAKAEGVTHTPFSCVGAQSGWGPTMRTTAQQAFTELWDSLNSKRSPWASNPFVWVVGFKLLSSEARKVA